MTIARPVMAAALAAALAAAGSAAAAAPLQRSRKKPPPDYELRVPPKAVVGAGKREAISLTISARPGYTISRAGPVVVRVAVSPQSGIALDRRRYLRKHAADKRADDPRFDIWVRAVKPGSYKLEIDARFWVCERRSCRPIRERRAVIVEARAAAADPRQ